MSLRCGLGLAVLLCLAPGVAHSASSPTIDREIEALLERLENSHCSFQRNGQWHDAAKARSHLERKLRYLEKRATMQSAEQFIELAATRSSMSGEAYRVRCADHPDQESAQWFLEQLPSIRAASSSRQPTRRWPNSEFDFTPLPQPLSLKGRGEQGAAILISNNSSVAKTTNAWHI